MIQKICERGDELWRLVLDECEKIGTSAAPGGRQSRRSSAMYGADGRSVSALLWIEKNDGSNDVYHLTARDSSGRVGMDVNVDGPWTDNHDKFWQMQLRDRTGAWVIGHTHYRVHPDLPNGRRDGAGHAGRLFRIRRLDNGEVFETRNLWFQGTVPPAWRDQFPDTAEFVPGEQKL
jgi:hypothetical protein